MGGILDPKNTTLTVLLNSQNGLFQRQESEGDNDEDAPATGAGVSENKEEEGLYPQVFKCIMIIIIKKYVIIIFR